MSRTASCLRRTLLAALIALVVPAAARGAEFTFFKTPSGNIGCAFFNVGGKQLRCDLLQVDNTVPSPPASCDADYGRYFALTARGRPHRICVGDTVFDPKARTVAYGKSIERFGITCRSKQSGLRCVNRRGHGFQLARAKQTLF